LFPWPSLARRFDDGCWSSYAVVSRLRAEGFEARSVADGTLAVEWCRRFQPDLVVGSSLGADDYVTKPFSPGELVARIRTVAVAVSAVVSTIGLRFGLPIWLRPLISVALALALSRSWPKA
jgi:hypothetical protein